MNCLMKPHKFFSLKRFGRLLAADLRLNSKRYLYIIAGAAVGIYLLILFFMLSDQHYPVNGYRYFFMFYYTLLALGAYIGNAFPSFSEKTTAANFLLFPASNFEKLMSQFLLYFVAGTILFIFLFWVDAHLVRLSLSNLEIVLTGKWAIKPFSYSIMSQPFSSCPSNILEYCLQWMTILSIGCFLFTARLFFNKFALAKSIISGIVMLILVLCLMVLCSHLFFPEWTQGFQIPLVVTCNIKFFNVNNNILFIYSLLGIICIFFLPLAYFKLKEKQL